MPKKSFNGSILLLILVALGIIALLVYNRQNNEQPQSPSNNQPVKKEEIPRQSLYIVLSPNEIWYYDGKLSNSNDNSILKKQLFTTYINNTYVGNYHFLFNDKWYIYDESNNFYDYEVGDNIIAFSGDLPYSYIMFEDASLSLDDYSILDSFLKSKDITVSGLEELTIFKSLVDLNKDGVKETIYSITNAFIPEVVSNSAFGYILVNNNGKLEIMYEDKQSNDAIYNICMPYLESIIDLNVDNNYEFITNCEYYSEEGRCKSAYEYRNGKFEMIKSCS